MTTIDVPLVRRLVTGQFPQWSELPIRPVAAGGHDNRTFRLGDEMCVRLPSASRYAAHVAIEHEWLPRLAPQLPLPIPVPLGLGAPADGYPWPWLVSGWLAGDSASVERIRDQAGFGRDLAGFLNALQSLDVTNAPRPGEENFFRGGELEVYDAQARESIELLRGVVDDRAATAVWESALAVPWERSPVWIHGDVAAGNLLTKNGRLAAVIDFGQLAAGDPSCDTTIAWTLLSGSGRETFRSTLRVDENTWRRGRGWALWKAMLQLRDGQEPAVAARVIGDVIAEASNCG